MEPMVWTVEEEGIRLDQFVTAVSDFSRSFVQSCIKEERITVDGVVRKSNFRLAKGMVVVCTPPPPVTLSLNPENIPLDILYEDSDIVVINKSRGMVVHPALGNYTGTLVHALLYHVRDLSGINGTVRPGIVHRLDKDTSGVMIVAKNDEAHAHLAAQIKNRTASRRYYALVHGNIEEGRGRIDAPIGRDPRDRVKMAVEPVHGRPAVTRFTVLERYGAYTLVECVLETGRTHQIRVHMQMAKHPVVNDPLYGPRLCPFPIQGQALHAHRLDVVHPRTGLPMHWEAPLPQDFIDCIAFAKEHPRGYKK